MKSKHLKYYKKPQGFTYAQYFKKESPAGFTLIELLVVISIISLLASIMAVSIKNARLDARDTKRKQDLSQLNTALGLYYDANGHYPNGVDCGPWAYSTDANWNTTGCLITALKPYLSQIPVDPINIPGGPWNTGDYDYVYAVSPTAQAYDLVAQLENTGDPAICKNKQYVFEYYTPLGGGLYSGSSITASWCAAPFSYSNYMYADH